MGFSCVGFSWLGFTWVGLEGVDPEPPVDELSMGTGTMPVSEALVVQEQGSEEDTLALPVADVTGTGVSEEVAVSMEVAVSVATAEECFAGTAPAELLAARARRVTAWVCLKCILFFWC